MPKGKHNLSYRYQDKYHNTWQYRKTGIPLKLECARVPTYSTPRQVGDFSGAFLGLPIKIGCVIVSNTKASFVLCCCLKKNHWTYKIIIWNECILRCSGNNMIWARFKYMLLTPSHMSVGSASSLTSSGASLQSSGSLASNQTILDRVL